MDYSSAMSILMQITVAPSLSAQRASRSWQILEQDKSTVLWWKICPAWPWVSFYQLLHRRVLPPSKKVRFVSVNDHFDIIDGINNQVNETSSQIRTPITNAFNEQISLDIRKKTQSILGMKVTRGISIGPWAPFVYRKTENDHLKLGSWSGSRWNCKIDISYGGKEHANQCHCTLS